MIRVVQIAPGPMPTFTASTPASIRSLAPSAVATLPAITWMFQFFLISRTVSITFLAWPWAVSTTTTSTSGLDQRLDALEVVHARRRPDPQPAALVLAGVGVLVQLVDVAAS